MVIYAILRNLKAEEDQSTDVALIYLFPLRTACIWYCKHAFKWPPNGTIWLDEDEKSVKICVKDRALALNTILIIKKILVYANKVIQIQKQIYILF